MEHEFTLRFSLGPADAVGDVETSLSDWGKLAAQTRQWGQGPRGRYLWISRSATSLEQAIRSAIDDVKTAIPTAELYSIEPVEGGEQADSILTKKLAIMEGLMAELVSWIEVNQLTHAQAAQRLGVKTQWIDEVFKRNTRNFTIDFLVDMLLRAGKQVHLRGQPEKMAVGMPASQRCKLADLMAEMSHLDLTLNLVGDESSALRSCPGATR